MEDLKASVLQQMRKDGEGWTFEDTLASISEAILYMTKGTKPARWSDAAVGERCEEWRRVYKAKKIQLVVMAGDFNVTMEENIAGVTGPKIYSQPWVQLAPGEGGGLKQPKKIKAAMRENEASREGAISNRSKAFPF